MTSSFAPRFDVSHTDVQYAETPEGPLLARVYRPDVPVGTRAPAVVEVHGGAWTFYDRTAGALHCTALAACGIVVVALDFRQGPAHKHPAASADVARGVRYVRAHAAALGVDPARIGLLGTSSGGHLSLLVGIKPGTPEHGGDAPAAAVRCVVALFPVSDPHGRYQYAARRAQDPDPRRREHAERLLEAGRGYFGDEPTMEQASVPRCVLNGEWQALPPIFVGQPELDRNVPREMSDGLVAAYRSAGGEAEYRTYPDQHHGFVYVAGEATDACLDHVRAFLAKHL